MTEIEGFAYEGTGYGGVFTAHCFYKSHRYISQLSGCAERSCFQTAALVKTAVISNVTVNPPIDFSNLRMQKYSTPYRLHKSCCF